jgi:hypothetical protein
MFLRDKEKKKQYDKEYLFKKIKKNKNKLKDYGEKKIKNI